MGGGRVNAITLHRRQSAITRHAPPVARKAARMVGFALILDTPVAWSELADWMALRMPQKDRASLAFAALRSLPDPARALVVEAAE